MNHAYRLDCPCGAGVTVTHRQAGESVRCPSCGRTLDIPKLRDLRELPTVEITEPTRRKSAAWTPLQGSLFVAGMLALVIGASSTGYLALERSRYETEPPDLSDIRFNVEMDSVDLETSWSLWERYSQEQLELRPTPYHVLARQRVAQINGWMIGTGSLAALGLALVGASLLVRGSSANQSR